MCYILVLTYVKSNFLTDVLEFAVEEVDASSQGMVEMMENMACIFEQSSGNTQIMAAASEQQLASMEEFAGLATSLANRAEKLSEQLNKFKT